MRGMRNSCSQFNLVFLDDRVGEKLLAHILQARAGLGFVALRKLDVDDLALAHVADRAEAQTVKRVADGFSLRIENAVFQRNKDACFHRTRTGPFVSPCPDSGMIPRRLATSE